MVVHGGASSTYPTTSHLIKDNCLRRWPFARPWWNIVKKRSGSSPVSDSYYCVKCEIVHVTLHSVSGRQRTSVDADVMDPLPESKIPISSPLARYDLSRTAAHLSNCLCFSRTPGVNIRPCAFMTCCFRVFCMKFAAYIVKVFTHIHTYLFQRAQREMLGIDLSLEWKNLYHEGV